MCFGCLKMSLFIYTSIPPFKLIAMGYNTSMPMFFPVIRTFLDVVAGTTVSWLNDLCFVSSTDAKYWHFLFFVLGKIKRSDKASMWGNNCVAILLRCYEISQHVSRCIIFLVYNFNYALFYNSVNYKSGNFPRTALYKRCNVAR